MHEIIPDKMSITTLFIRQSYGLRRKFTHDVYPLIRVRSDIFYFAISVLFGQNCLLWIWEIPYCLHFRMFDEYVRSYEYVNCIFTANLLYTWQASKNHWTTLKTNFFYFNKIILTKCGRYSFKLRKSTFLRSRPPFVNKSILPVYF